MDLVFVHPYAALVALAAVLPLAALALSERRSKRVRAAIGLSAPGRKGRFLLVGAVAVLAALLGAASAQPVLVGREPLYARQDAEAYVVVDITRSMLASSARDEPTRLERAVVAARRLRAAIPDVPVGLASFTNRVVPHIFPTLDRAVFGSGLTRSIAIEQPPPDATEGALHTAFDALAPLQTHGFFAPRTQRRVAVVVTDAETRPVSADTIRALRDEPRVDLLIVRVWREGERIHRVRAQIDAGYRSDPQSTALLRSFATATGARVYDEGAVDEAAQELRRRVGSGERVQVGTEQSSRPLTAWTLALALVPLGYLLWRRNV